MISSNQAREKGGRSPFHQKFRFEFPEISSGEWDIISRNFQERGNTREVYPNFRKFFYREFGSLQFWDQYLHFENSTIFGFSEKNFPRTFSYYLAAFKRLRSFQIEWKVSWVRSEVRRFKMWSENEQIHIPLRIKLANSSSLSLS